MSPCFIPSFYTQSTVHVLYWPETYDSGPCKSTQTLSVTSVWETTCFLFCLRTGLKSPWLWGNSYWAFTLPKQRTKVILWELNPFPMTTLWLGSRYLFCAQKSRPAKWKLHISKALVLVALKGHGSIAQMHEAKPKGNGYGSDCSPVVIVDYRIRLSFIKFDMWKRKKIRSSILCLNC